MDGDKDNKTKPQPTTNTHRVEVHLKITQITNTKTPVIENQIIKDMKIKTTIIPWGTITTKETNISTLTEEAYIIMTMPNTMQTSKVIVHETRKITQRKQDTSHLYWSQHQLKSSMHHTHGLRTIEGITLKKMHRHDTAISANANKNKDTSTWSKTTRWIKNHDYQWQIHYTTTLNWYKHQKS